MLNIKKQNFKPGYTVYTTEIRGKPIEILCLSENTKWRMEREKLESNLYLTVMRKGIEVKP